MVWDSYFRSRGQLKLSYLKFVLWLGVVLKVFDWVFCWSLLISCALFLQGVLTGCRVEMDCSEWLAHTWDRGVSIGCRVGKEGSGWLCMTLECSHSLWYFYRVWGWASVLIGCGVELDCCHWLSLLSLSGWSLLTFIYCLQAWLTPGASTCPVCGASSRWSGPSCWDCTLTDTARNLLTSASSVTSKHFLVWAGTQAAWLSEGRERRRKVGQWHRVNGLLSPHSTPTWRSGVKAKPCFSSWRTLPPLSLFT